MRDEEGILHLVSGAGSMYVDFGILALQLALTASFMNGARRGDSVSRLLLLASLAYSVLNSLLVAMRLNLLKYYALPPVASLPLATRLLKLAIRIRSSC